ncbi:Splicing regulatory glutamine/lysine-rich protein 1, partial [Ophiophagus hannah]
PSRKFRLTTPTQQPGRKPVVGIFESHPRLDTNTIPVIEQGVGLEDLQGKVHLCGRIVFPAFGRFRISCCPLAVSLCSSLSHVLSIFNSGGNIVSRAANCWKKASRLSGQGKGIPSGFAGGSGHGLVVKGLVAADPFPRGLGQLIAGSPTFATLSLADFNSQNSSASWELKSQGVQIPESLSLPPPNSHSPFTPEVFSTLNCWNPKSVKFNVGFVLRPFSLSLSLSLSLPPSLSERERERHGERKRMTVRERDRKRKRKKEKRERKKKREKRERETEKKKEREERKREKERGRKKGRKKKETERKKENKKERKKERKEKRREKERGRKTKREKKERERKKERRTSERKRKKKEEREKRKREKERKRRERKREREKEKGRKRKKKERSGSVEEEREGGKGFDF